MQVSDGDSSDEESSQYSGLEDDEEDDSDSDVEFDEADVEDDDEDEDEDEDESDMSVEEDEDSKDDQTEDPKAVESNQPSTSAVQPARDEYEEDSSDEEVQLNMIVRVFFAAF